MFSRMMQTVNQTDSLHLSPPQQKDLLDYAKSLPARFKAVRVVEAREADVATRALQEWEQAHPELGPPADFGWPEAVGDLRLVVRAAALGGLMDDPDYADARAGSTLRRALGFLDVPAGAVNDLFSVLTDAAREGLPPAAADLILPHLDRLAGRRAPAAV